MIQVEQVAIVGAGPSGLAAIKACLEEGLKPQAFERTDQLGGVWVYRDGDDQNYPEAASAYKTLKSNTSKAFLGFTDFPSPVHWTPFVSHQKCLAFIQDYAKTFELERYIKFDTEVTNLVPTDDYETTGRWKLRHRSRDGDNEDVFDAVMICSGYYAHANLPKYPGQESFKGDLCSGSTFRTNNEYSDKTVLVVGGGVSAGDIALDISNVSKQTYISSRHGFAMYGLTDVTGWPTDVIMGCRYKQYLPPAFNNWLRKRKDRKRFRLHELGFRDSWSHGKSRTSVIANDNFINQALCGRILPKPGVECFSEHGVSFTDGTSIEGLDAVVLCTGYKVTLPYVGKKSQLFTANGLDLYKLIIPVNLKYPNLACIGFFKNVSSGSPILVQDMQARWAVQVLKGNCLLPSKQDMLETVQKRRIREHEQYGRDVFKIQAILYNDELAADIGCYPSLIRLLILDPRLAIHMFFSPVVPATYRLVGPHSWDGARKVILNCWETMFSSDESVRYNRLKKEVVSTPFLLMTKLIALTLVVATISYIMMK